MAPKVLVLMGSFSDLDMVIPAIEILEEFGVGVKREVSSAHRSPGRTEKILEEAEKDGVEVIIAAAGYAAHLAGVAASHTTLPVIGVPLDLSPLGGLDSLLSTVMMPAGVPVAAVAIGKTGSKNAAYLALSILSIKYKEVKQALHAFRKKMEMDVIDSSGRLHDHDKP